MPYELRGNKVCKVGGGVVKDHGSDHAAAVRHLRALKANVEEGGMSGVLGALLEGAFDEAKHPRGFHGRWVRGRGGRPGRLEGTYNGVKLERGVAYQGELAGGKVFTGHWTGEVQGFGRDAAAAQEPVFRHVDDPTMRRTFSGGKFYGRLSDVKPRALPTSRRATLGRAEGDAAARTRAEILAKSPGAQADLERYQSIARSAGRPNPMSSSSRERGLADIEAGRRSDRPRIRPEDRPAFDPITMLGREGTAARERGASSRAVIHADIRDKLTNLPEGQRYGLAGPQGGVGHVLRKSGGFEVYTSGAQPDKVHKTPSAAAAHAMKLERTAFEGTQRTADVMARNYRHGQEVRAMNERQSQRAEAEAERQLEIRARMSSSSRDRALAQTELDRRRSARTSRPRVRESMPAPELLGALLEGR